MTTTVVNGLAGLQGVFDEISERHRDGTFKPTLKAFADGPLKETHAEFFARSAGPSGKPWPEWYWRDPKAHPSHPTLVSSKRLHASLTTDSADHVQDVQPRELAFGTRVEYSALHNYGGEVRTNIGLVGRRGGYLAPGTLLHMPEREHVGMAEPTLDEFTETVADAAVENLKA